MKKVKVGKVSENVLKRAVFKQIRHRREEVLIRGGVGEDCAAVELGEDEVVVLSTDPITGAAKDIGTLAVHITANDIASSGAEVIGILTTIILPERTREIALRRMMQEIEEVCQELGIEVMGGHTEVSNVVNQPLITVTGVGKIKKSKLLRTKGLEAGDELVMTKWAGLEGTSILANEKYEELTTKYTEDFISTAKDFMQYISVIPEARIAVEQGACAMHDITEGGVYGAIWEMASASNLGAEVDLKKIPIRQETIEICEFFDLNPYQLISSGCMLIGTKQGNALVEALEKEGIQAAVIGKIVEGNDKVVISGEERRFLEPPKSDELYKALEN